jgi:SNF2 family DNA or RNA helicase
MYEVTDWQAHDLRFLAPMPYSANWSQMGCFKTSTALWLLQRKKVRNALIITSATGKGAYFSDFYRCLPESWELYNTNIHECKLRINDFEKPVDLDEILTTIDTGYHNHPMVLLAHYDVFTNRANSTSAKRNKKNSMGIVDKLKKIKWDSVLCDEAHRLKNPKTQWTRNIKRLEALHKHIMTGTAFINNPAELWSLLNFLYPTKWNSYWSFRNTYCDEYMDARGFRVIRGLRKEKVDEFRKLRMDLGPRRMMAEVHKNITEPIESTHEVELNTVQRKMYSEIKAVLQTLDQKGNTLQSPNVLSQLNRLRQISVATPQVESHYFDTGQARMVYDIKLVEPSSKLDEVMDILAELDDPKQQVVIFSNFKDPLHLLENRLAKAKIPYLHMEQKHSETQRYKMWHDDFPRKEHKVFMSTLALGGESINLTSAQYLIFLDRSWSPKDMMQAIGRVYRPGQKHAVEVIYINARKTVDSYVRAKLDIKGKWFQEIFGEEQS